MAIRCVYTDIDGTLLGRGASLFSDDQGGFSMFAARALETCARAGVEVVLYSGRRRAQVQEDARLIGHSSYIYELGGGLVIDGEVTLLCEPFESGAATSVYDQIEATGAPKVLLDAYEDRLEAHSPWHRDREISHLMRGLVDTAEANALLERSGYESLRLVDNGTIGRQPAGLSLEGAAHAYHLVPRHTSKRRAVSEHMRARGLQQIECVGVGDSREDLAVSGVVGRFFVVKNALDRDPLLVAELGAAGAELCEGPCGEGFYEAVVRSLADAR